MNPNTNYQIQYTNSFFHSLKHEIYKRKYQLTLSKQQINKFTNNINYNIQNAALFPFSNHNIANRYEMRLPTHEILIDNRHVIFYRCNALKGIITIGSLFNSRQMAISFI